MADLMFAPGFKTGEIRGPVFAITPATDEEGLRTPMQRYGVAKVDVGPDGSLRVTRPPARFSHVSKLYVEASRRRAAENAAWWKKEAEHHRILIALCCGVRRCTSTGKMVTVQGLDINKHTRHMEIALMYHRMWTQVYQQGQLYARDTVTPFNQNYGEKTK